VGGVRRDDDFHRLADVHDPRHAGRQARIGPVETGECGALIPVAFSQKFVPPKCFSRRVCLAGTIPGPGSAPRIVDSIAISQISSFRQNGVRCVRSTRDRRRGSSASRYSCFRCFDRFGHAVSACIRLPPLRLIMRADRDSRGRGATRGILAVPRLAARAARLGQVIIKITIIGLFLVLSRAKWRLCF
jgi:hypothetical protein